MEKRQLCLIFIDQVKQVGLKRVLNVVREGESLTVSGRLFQISADAQLKECWPKFVLATETQSTGRLTEMKQTMEIRWLQGVECLVSQDCDLNPNSLSNSQSLQSLKSGPR